MREGKWLFDGVLVLLEKGLGTDSDSVFLTILPSVHTTDVRGCEKLQEKFWFLVGKGVLADRPDKHYYGRRQNLTKIVYEVVAEIGVNELLAAAREAGIEIEALPEPAWEKGQPMIPTRRCCIPITSVEVRVWIGELFVGLVLILWIVESPRSGLETDLLWIAAVGWWTWRGSNFLARIWHRSLCNIRAADRAWKLMLLFFPRKWLNNSR